MSVGHFSGLKPGGPCKNPGCTFVVGPHQSANRYIAIHAERCNRATAWEREYRNRNGRWPKKGRARG